MTKEAFQNTVFVLKDEMYRFAKRFLPNDAEDIVQELMLKFWQNKEQLPKVEKLKSYVMRCVKNECLNRLKHEKIKMEFSHLQIYKNDFYVSNINNLTDEIIKFINALPEKQKMVIHLKDVEEYEIKEIAEILEIEENAVRVNLMRARQKVKEQITQLMKYEQRIFTK